MTMTVAAVHVLVLADGAGSNAVSRMLARVPLCRLVGRVETIDAAASAMATQRAEVVVAELSTPDRLRALSGGLNTALAGRLVVVSALPAEAALMPVLAGGARAFVRRTVDLHPLELAVSAVAAGHSFLDPASTRWLIELALHGHRSRPNDGLTLRQSQVLELVRGGLTNREIACVLGVSLATVKSHLNDAMHRLGVADRWSATALAERLRGEHR